MDFSSCFSIDWSTIFSSYSLVPAPIPNFRQSITAGWQGVRFPSFIPHQSYFLRTIALELESVNNNVMSVLYLMTLYY